MNINQDHVIRAELTALGLRWTAAISWNEPAAALFQKAVSCGEAQVAHGGALVVTTGEHTGRSPNDKFIVCDDMTSKTIWWENNKAITPEQFEILREDFFAHARLKSLYVQDLVAGADANHALPTRVICEYAWHGLFMQHMLRKTSADVPFIPKLTIIDLPTFKANPARHGTRSETVIAIDLKAGLVLIGGTQYAGEMKKAVFTVLNYLLPEQNVLPMHCSANQNEFGETALFFGLSGTGKTTLSADPSRQLIGDDEHGWSNAGIFNFEGGCYAKVHKLSPSAEPEIYNATKTWGTILENVVLDSATHQVDLADGSMTENTRAAFPLCAIGNANSTGQGKPPKTIIMLTADAFGVLPPIAKLNPQQAMYHFLSGYTAKIAGTERGVTAPQATFSTCFDAPFIPRHPEVYGDLLQALMNENNISCFLVNTGWSGGAYGEGQRMPIKLTRLLLHAALTGALDNVATRPDPFFGFEVPLMVKGVEPHVLNPRETWKNAVDYDAAASNLLHLFTKNFERFGSAARVMKRHAAA